MSLLQAPDSHLPDDAFRFEGTIERLIREAAFHMVEPMSDGHVLDERDREDLRKGAATTFPDVAEEGVGRLIERLQNANHLPSALCIGDYWTPGPAGASLDLAIDRALEPFPAGSVLTPETRQALETRLAEEMTAWTRQEVEALKANIVRERVAAAQALMQPIYGLNDDEVEFIVIDGRGDALSVPVMHRLVEGLPKMEPKAVALLTDRPEMGTMTLDALTAGFDDEPYKSTLDRPNVYVLNAGRFANPNLAQSIRQGAATRVIGLAPEPEKAVLALLDENAAAGRETRVLGRE